MYKAAKKIKELREQGWKVKVRMERIVGDIPKSAKIDPLPESSFVARHEIGTDGSCFNAKGGRTKVVLIPPNTSDNFNGMARCHPFLDNFDRRIGLEIAFSRAWKEYEQLEKV